MIFSKHFIHLKSQKYTIHRMANKDPLPLIRTKLHRPPVAGDHVHRPQLLDRLNKQLHRSLTLGSAPAGRTAPRL
jgi:hypothetical protein